MARNAPPKPRPKRNLAKAAGPSPVMQQAQAELDPIIAAITGAANKKAAASEAAIKGYTDSYAQQLGGMDAGAPYQGAEQGQAAVDASLRQSLAGGGSDLASGLAARLAALQGSSGAGALAQEGDALASQGESAGNTRLASGSAALSALLGEHAAASSFSDKLPGLAKLSGLQGLKQAEGNAHQDIAQGTLQAEGELPNIVQQIRSSRQSARALASENAYRQAQIGLSAQRNQISATQGAARIGIAQQNANTSAFRANVSAAHMAQEEKLARANYGISLARLQLAQQKAVQVRKQGGLTPSELDTVHSHAQDFIKGVYEGVPGHVTYPNSSNGLSSPRIDSWKQKPIQYKNAIKLLLQRYPALGPGAAIKIADSFYRPGEGGRPAGKQPNLSLILGQPGTIAGPKIITGSSLGSLTPHEATQARAIIRLTQQYVGTPYVWGGASPKGFDCSGLAQYIYGKVGIRIPRTTYTQWQTGRAVPHGALAPGDLVFFRGSDSKGGLPGHVGIYIGGGKMIDAPHTGSSVRIEDVATFGGFMGARRYD